MEIKYCEKCHNKKQFKSIQSVKEDLKAALDNSTVDIGCLSYCAVANNKFVVTIDDEIVEADSYDELILKVKEFNDN